MNEQEIMQFLSTYGYVILVPLMIAEGPTAAIVGAFMASRGVLNVWIVLFLSIISDVIGDVFFYYVGYKWGMTFVRRIGKHVGITQNLVLSMKEFFVVHGGKTIMTVKATTGLCWATFIAAGIVEMPVKRFVKFSFLGGIVWSSFLVVMGYFFGYLYGRIAQYISYAGWIIFGLTVVILVAIFIFKRYRAQEFLAEIKKDARKKLKTRK